jgi:hypothetical protein
MENSNYYQLSSLIQSRGQFLKSTKKTNDF